MSPTGFVLSEALSTAFSPLTPVAPPADVLMRRSPSPSGWHLIVRDHRNRVASGVEHSGAA